MSFGRACLLANFYFLPRLNGPRKLLHTCRTTISAVCRDVGQVFSSSTRCSCPKTKPPIEFFKKVPIFARCTLPLACLLCSPVVRLFALPTPYLVYSSLRYFCSTRYSQFTVEVPQIRIPKALKNIASSPLSSTTPSTAEPTKMAYG
jgi:hypothetical protein